MVALVSDEGAQIAGYPLVRALRRDAEREVWVAAGADDAGGVELHRSLSGAAGALAREAEALLAVGHPHLVPILDVATDEGAVLVRPLLPHSLAEWLVQRQAPPPGEAVTALAPIAAALAALHAVGASAGGCDAQGVRIDADGAPLLMAEGAQLETTRPTAAWRESSEGVAEDAAGWRRVALAVLEAGGATLPEAAERALEQRDLAGAGDALLAAWAALPLGVEPAESVVQPQARMRRRERAVGVEAVWARVALLAERLVERGGPSAARAVAAASSVRPRFWAIAAGGAAALVVAAVLLWPPGEADAGAAPTSAPTTAATTAPDPSAAVPAPAATTAEPDASAAPAVSPVESSQPDDDPVAAVAALLAEREACLDADDAACLVGLHEPGSPLLLAAEPWRMPEDGTVELVQRLGDAWLLRVVSERQPASVLAMSTEAGWTLRDAWSG